MSTAAKLSNKNLLSIGLMSGTSMDGIDAALLSTDGLSQIKELGHTSISYNPAFKILLKAAEYSVRKHSGNMSSAASYYWQGIHDFLKIQLQIAEQAIPDKISELCQYLHGNTRNKEISLAEIIQHSTQLHGLAVNQLLTKTQLSARQIDVVGYHGQTLLHQPGRKISIIVGDGQQLADLLQTTVVNDFRSRDVQAGGQGAPFAPLYHHALAIRDQKIPLAVVNCGGIANITLINSANELDLVAYDTGPGNGLIDRLVIQRTQGQEQMDAFGKYGGKGKVDARVLAALYHSAIIQDNQNYFAIKPPKSLDIGDMKLIPELDTLSLADACATLEAFTADTIVRSLKLLNVDIPHYWVLAGGGWHNPIICRELSERLQLQLKTAAHIQTADAAGWNSQALEAQIFAYLAVRSLQNLPLSLPGTTRVPQPLSGGQTYHPTLSPCNT